MPTEIIGTKDNQEYFVGQPAISTQQLQPAQAIQLPAPIPPVDVSGDVAGLETGAKNLDSFLSSLNAAQTPVDKTQQDILNSITSLTSQNTGREGYQIQKENEFGLPTYQKELSDLSSQIQLGMAELSKMSADAERAKSDLETRGVPSSVYFGQQAQIDRQNASLRASKASEIGLLQAMAAGKNGQIQTALSLASRATDLKYRPIEDDLKVREAQLAAIAPLLNKQEKQQALRQQLLIDERKTRVADEKAKAKENLNLALTAGVNTKFVNKNGEFFNTNTGETYSRPEDFFKAAGVRSFDQAYAQGLVSDVDNASLQNINEVSQLKAEYFDAGIDLNDTPEEAMQKIQKNSRKYRKETYIAPSGGGGGGVISVGDNPQLYAGLTGPTATAVRAQVNSFKSEPTVQNFAVIQEGKNFASSIDNKTKNPADDQALIYSLAKALDPGSVVREGEYATAQKYSQSWINAYGKGVEQAILGTGFLTETARQNIKKTIGQKYQASKTSYDNLYGEYAKSIGSLTGRDDGKAFLKNYSTEDSEGQMTDEEAYQLYLQAQ